MNTSSKDQKTAQNKYWLQSNVNDILEPLMLATFKRNTSDGKVSLSNRGYALQIEFMLKYLEETYGERATKGDKSVLLNMRNEATRLEALVAEQKAREATLQKSEEPEEDRGSEHETDEDVS